MLHFGFKYSVPGPQHSLVTHCPPLKPPKNSSDDLSFVAFDGQNFIRCFTATFTYHRQSGFRCPCPDPRDLTNAIPVASLQPYWITIPTQTLKHRKGETGIEPLVSTCLLRSKVVISTLAWGTEAVATS